jgi:hypothetical protein
MRPPNPPRPHILARRRRRLAIAGGICSPRTSPMLRKQAGGWGRSAAHAKSQGLDERASDSRWRSPRSETTRSAWSGRGYPALRDEHGEVEGLQGGRSRHPSRLRRGDLNSATRTPSASGPRSGQTRGRRFDCQSQHHALTDNTNMHRVVVHVGIEWRGVPSILQPLLVTSE